MLKESIALVFICLFSCSSIIRNIFVTPTFSLPFSQYQGRFSMMTLPIFLIAFEFFSFARFVFLEAISSLIDLFNSRSYSQQLYPWQSYSGSGTKPSTQQSRVISEMNSEKSIGYSQQFESSQVEGRFKSSIKGLLMPRRSSSSSQDSRLYMILQQKYWRKIIKDKWQLSLGELIYCVQFDIQQLSAQKCVFPICSFLHKSVVGMWCSGRLLLNIFNSMNTQRCVEDSSRRSIYQINTRYHSEESVDQNLISKIRKNMHSNQSHYLHKNLKEKSKSIELNEQNIQQHSDTQKLEKAKDINLPMITYKNAEGYKILLKKSNTKGYNNLVWLHQNKKMRTTKIKLRECGDRRIRNYSYLTSLGNRIKNEDRITIATINAHEKVYQYFAVFDGHGGYLTSNYLSLHLHGMVEAFLNEDRSPTEALQLAISALEDKLKKNPRIGNKSGSCALACLLSGETCWIANVGDSRMLAVNNESITQITKDHKPESQTQKARIISNGGEIYRNIPDQHSQIHSRDIPFRVYPGKLSVSRAIGDIHIKRENSKVVIAEPDVYTIDVKGFSHLLLFSDGIYEKLSNAEIGSFFQAGNVKTEDALRQVFDIAEGRRSEDNRSIIAVKIN